MATLCCGKDSAVREGLLVLVHARFHHQGSIELADFSDSLTESHVEFLAKQPVFFVSTACADGRINLSPKGYDAFRVLSPSRVAYLDLAGSGNETHAHLIANGRITLMAMSFDERPLILRIYGQGRPVLPQDEGWEEVSQHFHLMAGTRQIFDIEVESVQTSCGFGVPRMSLDGPRETLAKYHANTPKAEWLEKLRSRTQSIDGLPTRATDRYFKE